MPLRATDVFTPGSFPVETYVERTGVGLEQMVRDGLETPGQIVSLVGPSKSGKTVLVEKVVGRDQLITITGAGIQHADEIWARVLDWMDAPSTVTKSSLTSGAATLSGSASGSAGIGSVTACLLGQTSRRATSPSARRCSVTPNRTPRRYIRTGVSTKPWRVGIFDFPTFMPPLSQGFQRA